DHHIKLTISFMESVLGTQKTVTFNVKENLKSPTQHASPLQKEDNQIMPTEDLQRDSLALTVGVCRKMSRL
ncbi:MAG: hypothetical protein Q8835_02835, partial [Sweet potato little leaf phytoplasma]|nr:hypothetical protein [Sweet potato little leaf phytoplasma]